jgi:hypothetical protein
MVTKKKLEWNKKASQYPALISQLAEVESYDCQDNHSEE